jgi:hypothetical protein
MQKNYISLCKENPAVEPDFQLKFPRELTKKIYFQVVSKLFAGIRFRIYSEIRQIIRL